MTEDCKKCTRCGIVKPLTEYYKKKNTQDGLYPHCKTCHGKITKEYRETKTYGEDRKYYERYNTKGTCKIIKEHHEEMKDDPERLSTSFIQTIVGRRC